MANVEIEVPILNDDRKVVVAWGDPDYLKELADRLGHKKKFKKGDLKKNEGMTYSRKAHQPLITLRDAPRTATGIETLTHEASHAVSNILKQIKENAAPEIRAYSEAAIVRTVLSEIGTLDLQKLEQSEELETFLDGSTRSTMILGSIIIGHGEYLPGWKWSKHVGKKTGKESEYHLGYVISGQMAVRGVRGREIKVGPREAFEVGEGHDAWVVGKEPCVALDFESLKK